MLDSAMLQRLLDVAEPWRVADCRLEPDQHLACLRITPEPERGLFKTREVKTVRELRWRHLDLLGWKVEVTLALPPDTAAPDAPWCGEVGQPFTRALMARISTARRFGLDAESIALLFALPIEDVKLMVRLLDPARAAPAAVSAQAATAQAAPVRPSAPAAPPAEASRPPSPTSPPTSPPPAADATPVVPDVGSPVWVALVTGVIEIDIQQLGLKLLLNKMRAGIDEQPAAERARRAGELHTYFGRNLRQLGGETLQLMRAERRHA